MVATEIIASHVKILFFETSTFGCFFSILDFGLSVPFFWNFLVCFTLLYVLGIYKNKIIYHRFSQIYSEKKLIHHRLHRFSQKNIIYGNLYSFCDRIISLLNLVHHRLHGLTREKNLCESVRILWLNYIVLYIWKL